MKPKKTQNIVMWYLLSFLFDSRKQKSPSYRVREREKWRESLTQTVSNLIKCNNAFEHKWNEIHCRLSTCYSKHGKNWNFIKAQKNLSLNTNLMLKMSDKLTPITFERNAYSFNCNTREIHTKITIFQPKCKLTILNANGIRNDHSSWWNVNITNTRLK